MYRYKLIFIFLAILLTGCNDNTPVSITEQYSSYIGAWQTRVEQATGKARHIDNMLLIIHQDGKARYRKCEATIDTSEGINKRKRYAVDFPNAIITEISKKEIVIRQTMTEDGSNWLGFNWTLKIDKVPYQSNGDWYMEIEGKQLTKLSAEDIPLKTNWTCPEKNQTESKAEYSV